MTKKAKPTIEPEVVKSLEAAIAECNKSYGENAIILGEGHPQDVDVIPTGNIGIDLATGVGGLPRGRTVEIYGPEMSGKTTLALHVIAQAQRMGGVAVFVDAEHALDLKYAGNLGVKTDDLLISQPNCGEEALEITEKMCRTGKVWVIVIDSVAALVPRAEIEGEMGDSLPGLQARLMSQAMRKLTAAAHQTNTLIIFINQLRMKIGVMYGNPETTTGGNALKFYATMRLDCRSIGKINTGTKEAPGEIVGNRSRVRIAKNKLARPFQEVEFDILFGKGHDFDGILIEYAVGLGIIEKSGAWYSYNGDKLGQGLANARETIEKNATINQEIKELVLKSLNTKE